MRRGLTLRSALLQEDDCRDVRAVVYRDFTSSHAWILCWFLQLTWATATTSCLLWGFRAPVLLRRNLFFGFYSNNEDYHRPIIPHFTTGSQISELNMKWTNKSNFLPSSGSSQIRFFLSFTWNAASWYFSAANSSQLLQDHVSFFIITRPVATSFLVALWSVVSLDA